MSNARPGFFAQKTIEVGHKKRPREDQENVGPKQKKMKLEREFTFSCGEESVTVIVEQFPLTKEDALAIADNYLAQIKQHVKESGLYSKRTLRDIKNARSLFNGVAIKGKIKPLDKQKVQEVDDTYGKNLWRISSS